MQPQTTRPHARRFARGMFTQPAIRVGAPAITGAIAVGGLLAVPNLSLSGEWGTINGKPWGASEIVPSITVWTVVCVGVAIVGLIVGLRMKQGRQIESADETSPSLTAGEDQQSKLLAELSPREKEVFTFVARGLSKAQITQEAFIAETTVKSRIGNLLSKLHARSRSELITLALTSQSIDADNQTQSAPR